MANIFFPQLSTGAIAQYPIQRRKLVRTVKNQLGDGSVIALPDPSGSVQEWSLHYSNLSQADVNLLQAHFAATSGSLRAFTFIDPTDNMLTSSAVLTSSAWQAPSALRITGGHPDPDGGVGAFLVTNAGQIPATLTQTIPAPANFQYVFSLYAVSATSSMLGLVRTGSQPNQPLSSSVTSSWSRLTSSGTLVDQGVGLAVGISLAPGQAVTIYGLQLEAQRAPSTYKATSQQGGIYQLAHWGVGELAISAQGVDQFSTSFTIQSAVLG